MTKPLKAYYVGVEEAGEIVYAVTNAAARSKGANEFDCDWHEVAECRRAPHFDHLVPRGPTDEQKFDAGWWFECCECSGRATHDSGGVYRDGDAYCEDHADVYAWRDPLPEWTFNRWDSPYIWRRPR